MSARYFESSFAYKFLLNKNASFWYEVIQFPLVALSNPLTLVQNNIEQTNVCFYLFELKLNLKNFATGCWLENFAGYQLWYIKEKGNY